MKKNSFNIYIIEDESILLFYLDKILTRNNCNVIGNTTNGESAIEEIKRIGSQINLIITDIKLNGNLNGIETIKIVNNYFKIPVVFQTGYNDKEIIDKINQLNLDCYYIIEKREIADTLINIIDKIKNFK